MKTLFLPTCLGISVFIGLIILWPNIGQALDCTKSNLGQAEQLSCRDASLRWTTETIEQLMDSLSKRLDQESEQALLNEQKSWQTYRDYRCNTQGFQVLQGPEIVPKTRCIRQESEERLVVLANRLQSFFETQTSLLGPRDRSVLTALFPTGLYHVQNVFFVHADAAGGATSIQTLKRETMLFSDERLVFNGETCIRPKPMLYGVDVEQFFQHFYGQVPDQLMPDHPMPRRALALELDCAAGSLGPKNLFLLKEPGVIGLIYHDTAYIEFRYQF